jgi:hypothetical protein
MVSIMVRIESQTVVPIEGQGVSVSVSVSVTEGQPVVGPNMGVGIDMGMSMGMDGDWDMDGDRDVLLNGNGNLSGHNSSDGLLDNHGLGDDSVYEFNDGAFDDHGFVHIYLLRDEDGFVDILVDDDLSVDGVRLVHDFDDVLIDHNGLDLVNGFGHDVELVLFGRRGVRGERVPGVNVSVSVAQGQVVITQVVISEVQAVVVPSCGGQPDERGQNVKLHVEENRLGFDSK